MLIIIAIWLVLVYICAGVYFYTIWETDVQNALLPRWVNIIMAALWVFVVPPVVITTVWALATRRM